MRFVSKSTPALAVAGLLTAALIGLSGCGSDTDSAPEPESTPTATLDVVAQGFDSLAELSDYVAQSLDGVEVSLESETNPDFNEETEPERLHVDFASDENRAQDMEATALIVQATSQAAFDYDILMVTGDVSAGEWSYLYDRSTVEELTGGGHIVVADIWDSAEQSFDTIHR
ncbi:hypothetical protein [Brevibacterium sp. CFH 10365]|uniref:hypothetical protein n=1 Tax=Brevibacterium sp. CFH 10365 TaxID=2585207 RepID=UPI0012660695|nr:hypothetical protein [Brevibacterium sp. CFH 10365]